MIRSSDRDRTHDGGVLLTGGTGFVGMEILTRFLERSERPVYAMLRARDEAAAAERLRHTMKSLFGNEDAYKGRVFAVPGDLEQPDLALASRARDALAERVSDVVHCAASVSFADSIEKARQTNVDGTRRMLELADVCRRRGGLDHFSYISTAYVAGMHPGEFDEDQLDVGQRFRNPYEQSKFEAERLVRAQAERLPIQIFRPSIVVGERTTGWTASFNVLYTPLKAFVRGALPALPARRSSPVDVVPVDYVADAVFELSGDPADGGRTYHLVAGPQATSVGRLIELSAAHLGRPEPVVIPPGVFRRVVYPLLTRSSRKRKRGLEGTKVFFPYFSMDVSYANTRARARLEPAGIRVPPIESYFGRLLDYAARSGWGRSPITRAEAWQALRNEGQAVPQSTASVTTGSAARAGEPPRGGAVRVT
jgi:thioester reductase-like protein